MSPRDQLLKMQRIILRQLKQSVHRLQGEPPPEIEKYYQAYKREFKSYQKISNKTELLRAAKNADVVFGADFHPFAQSQRTHLRILRELVKSRRPLVLAMEAIESRFQNQVDAYLDGETDDKTFLKKINYTRSWGFPWENYKILFDFARNYDLPVYGINKSDFSAGDLARRDQYSAQQIVNLRERFPQAIIYVVYGDLHLASSHLPRLTKKLLGGKLKTRFLTVFQDSETLYWRLAKRRLEERVDVLKLRGDAYCVVNSPPWIKWQAYLNFLERSIDAGDTDLSMDYGDHISHFVKVIQKVWKIDRPMTDFHTFAEGDVRFAQQISGELPKKDIGRIMALVRNERSFFIPRPPVFYLHSFDVNHVVTLVGQYIHAKLRRESRVHLDFPKDFVPLLWTEAIGFFASKLINNRRKFSSIADLPSDHRVTLIALEQRLREQMALKTGRPLRPVRRHRVRRLHDYFDAARVVGAILGNRIYTAFQSSQLDIATLQQWLRVPVDSNPRFFRFYISILRQLKSVQEEQRSKNERL